MRKGPWAPVSVSPGSLKLIQSPWNSCFWGCVRVPQRSKTNTHKHKHTHSLSYKYKMRINIWLHTHTHILIGPQDHGDWKVQDMLSQTREPGNLGCHSVQVWRPENQRGQWCNVWAQGKIRHPSSTVKQKNKCTSLSTPTPAPTDTPKNNV